MRGYAKEFFENKFKFKGNCRQGKHERIHILNDESLRERASQWVRDHAFMKGSPNMNASMFCEFVNSTLLPSHHLPPNFPRNISLRTAIRWLHKLGFKPMSHKKGIYIDGHEREDVVKDRTSFLNEIHSLQGSHQPRPLCSDEDESSVPLGVRTQKKLVMIYHDESIFCTNEAQTWMWGEADKPAILPKTKGSGIMVSDFVEEHEGFLKMDENELEEVRSNEPDFPAEARELLEYVAEREGYWTGDKFMKQVQNAVRIAEHKYDATTHTLMWLFDQSSCQKAMSSDALNVARMNIRPGGAQSLLRDTEWPPGSGCVQHLVDVNGVAKGMKEILEERGINTSTLTGPQMRIILANHTDFSNEKTVVEHFLLDRGHLVRFIPKFHCELNPIERVWGKAKCYTRAYTNFTLVGLRRIIPIALDSVAVDTIRKYFRKARDYEMAYREGHNAGNGRQKYTSRTVEFFFNMTNFN